LDAPSFGSAAVADIDNDGKLEIVFAQHNLLGALSRAGSLEWSHPTGGSVFRGAAIADRQLRSGVALRRHLRHRSRAAA